MHMAGQVECKWLVKSVQVTTKADRRFNNDGFIYDTTKNEYICPAGEPLIWRYSNVEKA